MIDVLVAVGHGWESRLVTAIDEVPGVRVARRCPDLADLLAAVAAGHGDVAIVSADLRGVGRDAVARMSGDGVAVVGASAEGDEPSERVLRQLGVETVVHPGLDRDELRERLGTAARSIGRRADETEADAVGPGGVGDDDTVTDDEPVRGRVVAVWGPTGAPGRTTVAVGVASEAAALGVPTVLLDLDTYGASVAQALSMLDESPGIAAAARASELGTLDLVSLARLAPEVAPGLRVVSGVVSPQRWPELRASAVEQVLELARGLAPLVVLDLGFCVEEDEELSYDTAAPRRNATTLTALAVADDLLVVGAGDPVGLQRLVRAVQSLASVPSPQPRTVVNRVRAAAVGPDPQRRISESLERFAGLTGLVFVPDDPAATDAAMLAGATLAESAPSSPVRLALRALAADLLDVEVPRAERHERRGLRRARTRSR
ncbi:hypothetical protein L6241_08235 [Janibacter sp. Y6]|uniref:CpaE family protein n=1 Tax=Janibacter sp. Y6 TaxID=2913552 RepID=UPI0034A2C630